MKTDDNNRLAELLLKLETLDSTTQLDQVDRHDYDRLTEQWEEEHQTPHPSQGLSCCI